MIGPGGPISDDRVRRAYEAYNAQDVEQLLSNVSAEVNWPDGDRRLRGKVTLRAYWTDQWTRTRTEDVPVAITWLTAMTCAVQISQVVRSIGGDELHSGPVLHILQFSGTLIARLDIVPLTATEPSEPSR